MRLSYWSILQLDGQWNPIVLNKEIFLLYFSDPYDEKSAWPRSRQAAVKQPNWPQTGLLGLDFAFRRHPAHEPIHPSMLLYKPMLYILLTRGPLVK
ncbi:hypothetical protein TRIP_C20220 [Candidatus Zixiibacteriota bacterium]|nr:hypothetical protein TRIP_C20220 [candidate division Zixibacteria bacterium]